MEGKLAVKEKIEEEQDKNSPKTRPKNLSMQRRSEVYYFEHSERGILKSVAVTDGIYDTSNPETIVEKSASAKSRYEWSDVPLSHLDESISHEQRQDAEKMAVHRQLSHGLSDSTMFYENTQSTSDEYDDRMKQQRRQTTKLVDQKAAHKQLSYGLSDSTRFYENTQSTIDEYEDRTKNCNQLSYSMPLKYSSTFKNEDLGESLFPGERRHTMKPTIKKSVHKKSSRSVRDKIRFFENNQNTIRDYEDRMKNRNRDQKKDTFLKPSERTDKEKSSLFVETNSRTKPDFSEKYKNYAGSDNGSSSLMKLDERKSKPESLNERRIEDLSEALSQLSIETPVTEL